MIARLLDSYEEERRFTAERCIATSINNYQITTAVPAAIGLEPQALKLLNLAVRWTPLPGFFRRKIFDTALRIGLAQVKLLGKDNIVGNIRRKDLRSDTPYNTYTRFGLPPTPIANPGRAAIEATLNPDRTPYLFFVADGTGVSGAGVVPLHAVGREEASKEVGPLDVHVGSIAVKRLIEARRPLLTLHGHVHESARLTGSWREQIGPTWAFSAAHDGPELALIRFTPDHPAAATRTLL